MENNLPSKLLQQAVDELSRLPSVGKRTALRLAIYILKQDTVYAQNLAGAISNLREKIHYCSLCHNISDEEVCDICKSFKRDRELICVVEDVRDFIAIESTGQYNGLYHILGGIISPINGIGVGDVNIESLVERVATNEYKEIILALPTTIEGETTSLYIYKRLAQFNIEINTIARGVAFGDDLEYADQITLGRSIINRTPFQSQMSSKRFI
ncbi:recombination mediator RecR [Bacteroidales bacterium OttesenSCG-928-K03]|nr:recombination mediator RecR [Odoribacter sp. OttesenSCG-928-L07]MDL2242557.1 recombination mediator RecR [Bacteroidales bacterium OttesenSCG-928-K03]